MQPITIAVIGLGQMGRNHARILANDPRFNLVAVVEPEVASVSPEYLPLHLKSLDQLLSRNFQAAVVATPTETHYSVVASLLEAGKDVLVEKPTASTFEEAFRLVELAKSQQKKLAVGHIERCNPAVDAMARVVAEHVVGLPLHWLSQRCGGYPLHVKPGNQVFLDLAVHELDVLCRLASPVAIAQSFHHSIRQPGIPDLAEIQVDLAWGARGTVHVNWFTAEKIRTLRLTGSEGVAILDYIQQKVTVSGPNLNHLAQKPGYGKLDNLQSPCPIYEVLVTKQEPLQRQADEFYAYLSNKSHNLCCGPALLDSMKLLDECLAKSRVCLDHSAYSFWQQAQT